jgi:hypothetical protein
MTGIGEEIGTAPQESIEDLPLTVIETDREIGTDRAIGTDRGIGTDKEETTTEIENGEMTDSEIVNPEISKEIGIEGQIESVMIRQYQ